MSMTLNENALKDFVYAESFIFAQGEKQIYDRYTLIVQNNPDFANECVCCSFFQKEKVDFTKGTISTKVLLLKKIIHMGKENEMCQTVYMNPVYVK